MTETSHFRLQVIVFSLVSASFTNVYITQPVLPLIQQEFSADVVTVSFTVSAVILGLALSNLPFGMLADRLPVQPIILIGGVMVAVGGIICAVTRDLGVLIAARFLQGVFIPALTTCLAAYLAKTLPAARLNIVMGSYVSATVLGGLGGRLLGGWLHPPLHWRYAFYSAAALILAATAAALWGLPRASAGAGRQASTASYRSLLSRLEILRILFCAAGSFAVFSTVFNYLPFRLSAPPFSLSTEKTTLLYLTYVVGIFSGPTAGRISNRFGGGSTLIAGTLVLGCALGLLLMPSIPAIVAGLLAVCAGFFTVHAAAVGILNRKLSEGQGRANALYVLFYYIGGWLGITASGLVYEHGGWGSVVGICGLILCVPLAAGATERKSENDKSRPSL